MLRLFGLFQRWVGLIREPFVIYLALRNPRVPLGRKVEVVLSVTLLILYIVSPLDLIPEFLPFGFIDDLIVFPLATYFIERRLPKEVIRESRTKADAILRPFTLILDIIAAILLILIVIIIAAVIIAIVLLVERFR